MNRLENIVSTAVFTIFICGVFVCAAAVNVLAQTYHAPYDFDGDGKTDIAIYRPSEGQWWIQKSSDGSNYVITFGIATDKIMPADYTGDGKCDIAVWRPSTGEWFILRSEDFSYYSIPFGGGSDIPAPADFDGDGKTDIAVFRPSNGTWYIQGSLSGYQITQFGINGDIPVPADYDGDGKADLTTRRTSEWWFRRSTDGFIYTITLNNFDIAGDTIFPGGDYTGDGKADPSTFVLSDNSSWTYRRSTDGGVTRFDQFPNLTKVPGDYDGDHKIDLASFDPSNGLWTIYQSSGGVRNATFGTVGDKPVPNAYVRKKSELYLF